MRAKTVNENISFERGQDPKRAMKIGAWTRGYKVEYDPYKDKIHPASIKVINWGDYNWQRKCGSISALEEFTTVTKDIYRDLQKLPLVVFKGWDNMNIGGQKYFGLFGDWHPEKFEFYDTPFIARVEEDEESRNFLVAPEGYDYPRYITELV